MNHVSAAGDGIHQGLFVGEVSINELKVLEVSTQSLTDWSKLCLVRLITDGSADTEATILKELKAGPGTKISSNTGEDDKRLLTICRLRHAG